MSHSEFHIRLFSEADLQRLHDIRLAAYAPVFASFRNITGPEISPVAHAGAEEDQGKYLDEICQAGSGHTVFVAVKSGEIIGFCSYSLDADKKIGEIGLNAVDPAHEGQGIGTAMYDYALAEMKSAGMLVATVGTGGDESHAPARRAYEKAGFGPGIPSIYLYRAL